MAAALHRRIVVEGRWLTRHTLFLDNRTQQGVAGFIVATPLLIAPGDAVLVQRGWAPRDAAERTRVPAAPAAEGLVRIEARIAGWPSPRLALSSAVEARADTAESRIPPSWRARWARPCGRCRCCNCRRRSVADALQRDWPAPVARCLEEPGLRAAMVRAVRAHRRLGSLVRLDFTATTWTKKLNRWR